MFGETSGRRKRRRAFLDTLFEAFEEQQIDMDGIAEEVDTFMFEGCDNQSIMKVKIKFIIYLNFFLGHDTTAAAMNWAVQEIAANQHEKGNV